jgi:hypothetical protein
MSEKEWSDYISYIDEGPEFREKVERPDYIESTSPAQRRQLVDQISRALEAFGAPALSQEELTATRPKWRDVVPTGPQNETSLPPPRYMSPQARQREMEQFGEQQKLELYESILGMANIDFIVGTPTAAQKQRLQKQLENYERAQGRDSEFYKIILKRYKEYYGKHGMGKPKNGKCPKCGLPR